MKRFRTPRGTFFLLLAVCCVLLAYYLMNLKVEKSKPEPDIFLKAAQLLNVQPEKVYVIEDSYNGIRAAFTGGMIPIMVPDMLEPDDEMKEKAQYIFKDLYGVKDDIV